MIGFLYFLHRWTFDAPVWLALWSLCLQCFDLKCLIRMMDRVCHKFLNVQVEGWIGWISQRSPDTGVCLPQNHLVWSDTGSSFGQKKSRLKLKNHRYQNGSLICFFWFKASERFSWLIVDDIDLCSICRILINWFSFCHLSFKERHTVDIFW